MKKLFLCIISLVFVVMAGCAEDEQMKGTDISETVVSDHALDDKGQDDGSQKGNVDGKPETFEVDDNIAIVLNYYKDHDGREKLLYLNYKGQVVLYDLEHESALAEYGLEAYVHIQQCRLLKQDENEILLYIRTAEVKNADRTEQLEVFTSIPGTEKHQIHVLDPQLNQKKVYDLTEEMAYVNAAVYKGDGEVIFSAEDSLYYYGLETGKQTPFHEAIADQLENITLWEMAMSSDGEKIAFLGEELDNDENNVYGIIDLTNKKVTVRHTINNQGNMLHCSKHIVYITDGEIPFCYSSTGIIACMDLSSGEIYDYQVDNLESTTASLSENLKYLVAAQNILSEDKEKIIGWTIRNYDFMAHKELWTYRLDREERLVALEALDDTVIAVLSGEEGSTVCRYGL